MAFAQEIWCLGCVTSPLKKIYQNERANGPILKHIVCLFVELPLWSALDRDQQYFRDDSSSISLIREKVVSWRSNADPHFNPESFLAKVSEAGALAGTTMNYD